MSFLKFANSFQAVAKLRLESITALLGILGNPQNNLKFIHIAGTNGKGSVCAFLQNILTLSGLKVGKYTSPNMISVCERINISGQNISEDEMESLMEKVRSAAEEVKAKLGELPTPFEIWTAAAFCYFYEKKCDIVVLETGLGGERDATNVIPAPEIAVITRIALDHTEYLGETIEEIASAKAGIIKTGTKVITLPQISEAAKVIEDVCLEKGCPLIITKEATPLGFDRIYERFNYREISNIISGLGGFSQIENACLAIETALSLNIPENIIREGIKKAIHAGRLEIVSENPLMIFDGAHNINGLEALMKSLKRYFPNQNPTFVMAVMADKNYREMLEIIKENGYNNIRTVSVLANPRAETAQNLANAANELGLCATPFKSINSALENPSDLTVICGSLYLYKDYIER